MNIGIYQSFDFAVLKTTLEVLVIKQLGLETAEVEGVEVEGAAVGWNGPNCIGEDSEDLPMQDINVQHGKHTETVQNVNRRNRNKQ